VTEFRQRSPEPSTGEAPRLLAGRYQLQNLIASGGMAEVWRAHDLVLTRDVAVKILHSHFATDAALIERFAREARAAARLTHPAIVAIYDTIADGETNAIVMELISGITLREYMDLQGPLPPEDAIEIAAAVADALRCAHEAGIVHRDIKPANILLCDDRRVKVTDFGIAKVAVDDDMTHAGTLLGTAKYLSPEQVSGAAVDPRSDIYSLAVVLYEALCGTVPFNGDSDAAIALARLQREPISPRQIRPSISRDLDGLVRRALAVSPEDRPPTAAAFRASLLGLSHDAASDLGPDPTTVAHIFANPVDDSFVRSERRWIVPSLLIVIIGGSLILAGALFGRTDAGQNLFERAREVVRFESPLSSKPKSAPLPIVEAIPFDPFGSGAPGENDEQASAAIDGDPNTSWPTEFYSDRNMGVKPGVGFRISVGQPTTLDRLSITSESSDWAASIYVHRGVPATFEEWGYPITTAEGIAPGETNFDLMGNTGDSVLIWITDLGPGPPGEFRVRLANVALYGQVPG